MKNLITILLTTTLVLLTSVVFSQSWPSYPPNQLKQDSISGSNYEPSKESIRLAVESSFRIKGRRIFRAERVNQLIVDEQNKPNDQKIGLKADDLFDSEIDVPVIFNIIHDGEAYGSQYNPEDEDILVLLDMLNEQHTSSSTGFNFILGADGNTETAIRRFDRYDPANSYIVYGDPNTPYDDWPVSISCDATDYAGQPGGYYNYLAPPNTDGFSEDWWIQRSEYWALRYITRVAYSTEDHLNIYIIKMGQLDPMGAAPSYAEFGSVPGSSLNGTYGDFPVVPEKRHTGVFINSGTCNASGDNWLPALGNYPATNGIDLSDLNTLNKGDVYKKISHVVNHEVGHYLGLWNTFTAPNKDVVEKALLDLNMSNLEVACCEDNQDVLWYYSDILDKLEESDCEIHGDFCCDTRWSSSYSYPLNLSKDSTWDHCSTSFSDYQHDASSTLVQLGAVNQLLKNEQFNRNNVMNYTHMNQNGTLSCGNYFFTSNQIERMHDMTNVYRQKLISMGSIVSKNVVLPSYSSSFLPIVDIFGCTDPFALNYNPYADINDGSCYYECSDCPSDLDGNGQVNTADLLFLLTVFGTNCFE